MIGVGIVGTGGIAPTHKAAIELARALDGCQSLELVAAADIDECMVRKFCDSTSITPYFGRDALDQMLQDPRVSIVAVTTPSCTHAPIAQKAMEAGKHVLVEKPIAITLGSADRMVETANSNKVMLGACYQKRFTSGIMAARQAVAQGWLGEVKSIDINLSWCRTFEGYYGKNFGSMDSYLASETGRGKWKSDGGGVFLIQAPHEVDYAIYISGGTPCSVKGYVETKRLTFLEVEEYGVMSLAVKGSKYSDNAKIRITASVREDDNRPVSMFIEGSKGRIRVRNCMVPLGGWDISHSIPGYALEGIEISPTASDIPPEHHARIYVNFARSLTGHEGLLVTGKEALKSLEAIMGLYQSSKLNANAGKKNQIVQLPFPEDKRGFVPDSSVLYREM